MGILFIMYKFQVVNLNVYHVRYLVSFRPIGYHTIGRYKTSLKSH